MEVEDEAQVESTVMVKWHERAVTVFISDGFFFERLFENGSLVGSGSSDKLSTCRLHVFDCTCLARVTGSRGGVRGGFRGCR